MDCQFPWRNFTWSNCGHFYWIFYLSSMIQKIIKQRQSSYGQQNYEHPSGDEVKYEYVKHDTTRKFNDIDIHHNDAYGELELKYKY